MSSKWTTVFEVQLGMVPSFATAGDNGCFSKLCRVSKLNSNWFNKEPLLRVDFRLWLQGLPTAGVNFSPTEYASVADIVFRGEGGAQQSSIGKWITVQKSAVDPENIVMLIQVDSKVTGLELTPKEVSIWKKKHVKILDLLSKGGSETGQITPSPARWMSAQRPNLALHRSHAVGEAEDEEQKKKTTKQNGSSAAAILAGNEQRTDDDDDEDEC